MAAPGLYSADPEGIRWRVLDVRFGPPHHPPHTWSTHAPPDPAASFRAFVGGTLGIGGQREAKSYHWKDGERRTDLTEPTLQRQLLQAEWWDRRPVAQVIPGYVPGESRGAAG
jgi:hypothetical protein